MTALLLIHGRQQQMPKELCRTPEAMARHAAGKKRKWLGGLAKGLTLAGEAVPDPATAYLPSTATSWSSGSPPTRGRRRPT